LKNESKELIKIIGAEKWTSTCRRLKLDAYLSSCIKDNSKWVKGLNVILETETARGKHLKI
jgi:hypothetical protein